MGAVNTGGPAFPTAADNGHSTNQDGMTLRDYFAAKAMQSMNGRPDYDDAPASAIAMDAYSLADAMLEARNEGGVVDPVIGRIAEALGEMLPKYAALVWYARKAPRDSAHWDGVPEEHKAGAYKAMAEAEAMYPDEIEKLTGEHGDWEHGFNSGVLAALRYIQRAGNDVDTALELFPELDT